MSILNQYANSVINYSSQYSSTDYQATKTLGAPDSKYGGGGYPANQWIPNNTEVGIQTLTLGFATSVYATGVTVREVGNNGTVLLLK